MIPVSTALKRACESDTVVYKEYIVIDEETVEIKGKMSNTAYKDTTLFGTFNMKTLKFTTENNIDYKGKEFEYYKSVNGTAFKIGTYIVTSVVDNDTLEEVTVTAYDYALKFANQYETSLNYSGGSVTLYDVLDEVCTNCGVTLNNVSITNGDFIVDSNQFVESTQYGDVVAYVALMGGCFATINENDELELLLSELTSTTDEVNLLTEAGEELLTEAGENIILDNVETINGYVELDDKRDTQPITSVSIGWSDIEPTVYLRDLDLIAEYGEHWLRIVDCPFAYSTDKQNELITAIFNRVKGFRYSSFVAEYSFKPYVQLGDIIDFINKDGDRVHSIVLRIETDYDNITLSAPSIINATVDYNIPDTALSIAKRASIKVDEANAEIELKVSADEIISKINLSPEAIVISADKVNLAGLVTITALESDYSSNTELASSGSTVINGGNITTGNIQSANYALNTSGTKISLADGTIDTKNFKVSSTGVITATNGSFSGSITSNSGSIGGWNLSSGLLYAGSGSNRVGLSTGTYAIYAGNETASSAPFSVTNAGALKSTSGTIGGFTIGATSLIATNVGMSTSTYAFWAGSDTASSAPFRINNSGALTATSATITGTITSSTITGGTININSRFQVSSTGRTYISSSSGFFVIGDTTYNPYVSALNIAAGTAGLSFRDGTAYTNPGSQIGSIGTSGGEMITSGCYFRINAGFAIGSAGEFRVYDNPTGAWRSGQDEVLQITDRNGTNIDIRFSRGIMVSNW